MDLYRDADELLTLCLTDKSDKFRKPLTKVIKHLQMLDKYGAIDLDG